MAASSYDPFHQAEHTAHVWLADIGREFGTDDRRFAYRALRAWLHTLRDRLTAESAAAFAAQLPGLLRGVFYDGWQPHRVPVKYGPDEYVRRFAAEAGIPPDEVGPAAARITTALERHLAPGHLTQTLAQLPAPLRTLIGQGELAAAARIPGEPAPGAPPGPASAWDLLNDLKARVEVLTEAVRTLAIGFEEEPGAGIDEQRRARAARLAAEILINGREPSAADAGR